jgi:tyrosyl-tRNA synthetase
MSIPDTLIERYFRLASDATAEECAEVARALANSDTNPMTWKKELGHRFVRMYHGPDAANHARDEFEKQFSRREAPSEMPTVSLNAGSYRARDLLMKAFPGQYTGTAAGALFKQGAVYLNGNRVTDIGLEVVLGKRDGAVAEVVFKVGRKFARVVSA